MSRAGQELGDPRHPKPPATLRSIPTIGGRLVPLAGLLGGGFLVVLLASAILGGSLLATSARAASRYVLEKCDHELPGGGVEGAVFHGSPPFSGAQNCAEPAGSIFVVQQGDSGTGSGYWSLPLPPPPGGYVENVTVTGSMCNGAHQDAGTVAYAVEGGWALNCATQTHTFAINSPAGSPGLIYLGCEGTCLGAPEAWAGDFAATEVDPVAPEVDSIGGSLFSGSTARGHQTVTGLAEDEGGGLSRMSLRVNGQPSGDVQAGECATVRVANASYAGVVAARPTPCPPRAEAGWTINTATAPFLEGANTVSICAQDFSTIGPPNEGCATRTVQVDNSCPESATPGGKTVNAGFAHTAGTAKTVRYGRGAEVVGQLLGASDAPITGATICIATATEGSGFAQTASATTDAEGRFTYMVPRGPNRELRFGYRRDSSQIEQILTLDAHTRAALQASPRRLRNGQRVRLRGRLPGPGAAGRVVILQANLPGSHRWITFRKATTGERGRFKANYHFTSTTRKITYRFRALVPRQAGYPWKQGTSKAVSVVVQQHSIRRPNTIERAGP